MDYTEISKYMSYLLRHNPEEASLHLDSHGWVNWYEIQSAIYKKFGYRISIPELLDLVNTDSKHRYSVDHYKCLIRANQGHSIDVDIEMETKIPPDTLYHGTSLDSLDKILSEGIRKMSRNYIHLSNNYSQAVEVAKRRDNPIVLKINSKKMVEDGYIFKISENGIWQVANTIDPGYIRQIDFVED